MKKLVLRKSEITFMGHRNDAVLHPDPDKVMAIKNMRQPRDIQDLRWFLGLVNYLAKFMPRLTDTFPSA